MSDCQFCGSPVGHNASCPIAIEERNKELAAARSTISEQEKRIAELEAVRIEQNKQLDELNDIARERRLRIDDLELALTSERQRREELRFAYTNYRGEKSIRRVHVQSLRWGSSEWHPSEQWLVVAFDLDKGAVREFAVKDMRPPESAAVPADREEERGG